MRACYGCARMSEEARSTPGEQAADEGARLAQAAERQFGAAHALYATLHLDGQRASYREQLAGAIEQAHRALAALTSPEDEQATHRERARAFASAHKTLAKAHAAVAEDALHGAGQLSLSAQRAPTREACDEGWQRVAAIVASAVASASLATHSAAWLERHAPASSAARAARKAAAKADAAACAARRIVEQRNDAYTFHADSRFSFGEGWYLAAAAVLAGIKIQVEPNKDQTPHAEKFLADAGLHACCQDYRSRPRAMKHTTWIVAQAFRDDPVRAQQKLRAAFLGQAPVAGDVREWIDGRLPALENQRRVLLWVRDGVHHPGRNSGYQELLELTRRIRLAGLVPILTGDALRDGPLPEGALDTILFWKDPVFRGLDMRRAQLQFFEHLRSSHGVVGQLGVTTAGMDGPALLGMPTAYLTDTTNVRMRAWVGAVPGYQEVVRESGYLERVSALLNEWVEPPT